MSFTGDVVGKMSTIIGLIVVGMGDGSCVGKNSAVGLSVGLTGFRLGSGVGGSVNTLGDN